MFHTKTIPLTQARQNKRREEEQEHVKQQATTYPRVLLASQRHKLLFSASTQQSEVINIS